jgi:hypothetical protein
MVDIFLTDDQLGDLFYDLTVAIIGASPEPDVRQSWPEGGAPGWSINQSVTFLKVYEVPGVNEYHVQREDEYSQEGSPEHGNMSTGSTKVLQVNWIFYGPASWYNSFLVNNKIFHQEHRDTLALQKIYMIPNYDPPRKVPEQWQGLWYKRWDLTINFYELIVLNREVPYILTSNIGVVNESGEITTKRITQATKVRE